jgi:hypothetical protein
MGNSHFILTGDRAGSNVPKERHTSAMRFITYFPMMMYTNKEGSFTYKLDLIAAPA